MDSRVSVQKITGHASAILKGVLFTGISIQTVLGIVWMCCHFFHVPQFGESIFLMEVSHTLRCDEYTGILYPVFLRLAGRRHVIVYGVQLAAAFVTAWRFLRVFLPRGGWKTVWGSLAFVTIPMAMQCHMAILPCSFAASLLLEGLALLTEAVKIPGKRTLRRLAELSLCWLLLAFLLPEYLYLGAVPVALLLIFCCREWKGDGRRQLYGILLAAAFAGMIAGLGSLTCTPGFYGRLQKTPLMTLTQRVVWTSIQEDYEDWPWEMVSPVNEDIAWQAAEYADSMDKSFFPILVQAVADQSVSKEQAEAFCVEIMGLAWMWHGPEICKEILWDVLGYGASPVCLQLFLMGRGYDTYSRNYEFFLEKMPGLSRLYMDYGCWWFAVAAILTLLLQGLWLPGSRRAGRMAAGPVLCCLATAGILVIWYTMQGAGMQDYKDTVLILQLWMAWPVILTGREAQGGLPSGENAERELRRG